MMFKMKEKCPTLHLRLEKHVVTFSVFGKFIRGKVAVTPSVLLTLPHFHLKSCVVTWQWEPGSSHCLLTVIMLRDFSSCLCYLSLLCYCCYCHWQLKQKMKINVALVLPNKTLVNSPPGNRVRARLGSLFYGWWLCDGRAQYNRIQMMMKQSAGTFWGLQVATGWNTPHRSQ